MYRLRFFSPIFEDKTKKDFTGGELNEMVEEKGDE